MAIQEHFNVQDAIPGYGDLGWQATDRQYNDEFYVHRIHGDIDEDSQAILDIVDSVIPHRYDDMVATVLVPFKDNNVDYTEVIRKAGLALEGRMARIFDNGAIEVSNRSARIMDQLGILFDLQPILRANIPSTESQPDYSQSMQDSFESFDRYGPIEHEPDLPIVVYNRFDDVVQSNGHVKPPLTRMRQNPLIDGHGV